jgi:hypothetical protein
MPRQWRFNILWPSVGLRECLLPFPSHSFCLPALSDKPNIKMYKTIIVPVLLCIGITHFIGGRHRLRVFENRVMIISIQRVGSNIMKSFIVRYPHQTVWFLLIGILGGGVQLGPLGTTATNRPLGQPRVIMMMENLVEWLARETEVLGENVPQCRFVHHKPHMLPGREPEPPWWEASD